MPNKEWKTLDHHLLLDGKSVMDDAMPDLLEIKTLIPEVLHDRFDKLITIFEDSLAGCDVHERYEEKPRR